MGLLVVALSGALLLAVGPIGSAQQRLTEPAGRVFARAEAEATIKSEALQMAIGDDAYEFALDLEAGTIRFLGETRVVSAEVQVVGTYNTLDGTFLWGWDHPSVPEALAADARLSRTFGQRHRLPLFTTRKVECSEDEAWMFTAVALYLAGAQGLYRAPHGTTMVFLTLGPLAIAPVD